MSRKAMVKTIGKILTSKSPRTAYVGGWLGYSNLGDEALYAAMQRIFPTTYLLPLDGSNLPPRIPGLGYPWRDAVLAGGTIINGAPKWFDVARHVFSLSNRRFVFGSGVQDPYLWRNHDEWEDLREKWIPLFDSCSFVGVRGPHSAALLAESGFPKAEVIGDPALVFANGYSSESTHVDAGRVGLNIGKSGTLWGSLEHLVDEMASLANGLRQAGKSVEWYVVWPEDLDITKEAAKRSQTEQSIHLHFNDHEKFLDQVQGVGAFVGVKLHAVVLAICRHVPSLMLEYRPKCRDFMASIGHEDFTYRTDDFKADTLLERIVDMCENRDQYSARLGRSLAPVLARQAEVAKRILSSS